MGLVSCHLEMLNVCFFGRCSRQAQALQASKMALDIQARENVERTGRSCKPTMQPWPWVEEEEGRGWKHLRWWSSLRKFWQGHQRVLQRVTCQRRPMSPGIGLLMYTCLMEWLGVGFGMLGSGAQLPLPLVNYAPYGERSDRCTLTSAKVSIALRFLCLSSL